MDATLRLDLDDPETSAQDLHHPQVSPDRGAVAVEGVDEKAAAGH